MKIDVSKIKGYADMTAEEKLAALEAYDMNVDYSGYVKKDLLDKATSEAAGYKKQLREAMTEAERKAAEEKESREQMEARLAELEREKTITDSKAKLLAIGYDEALANKAAKALADGDMDKVFAAQKEFIAAREKEVETRLLGQTPKPEGNGGGGDGSMTKEKFMKLSLAEKSAFAKEDPDTYATFYQE